MTDRLKHHITKDGSSTFYSEQYQQYYHNPNGSVSESRHVFFEKSGLTKALQENKPINIFEVGFGTGLNFFLLMDYYLKFSCSIPIKFFSVEAFPLDKKQAHNLNFEEHSDHKELNGLLIPVFDGLKPGWNQFNPIPNKEIELNIFVGKFSEMESPNTQADFIYHDAFSPEVNAELWAPETFSKIKSFSNERAVLSTYCAASKARAAMAVAGWKLGKAQGALGKREMTIASLSEEKLSDFKRVNEGRLIERYEAGDFDR